MNSSKGLSTYITKKVVGYEKPTIWYKYSRLAAITKSVNLGQGFPNWSPPQFLLDNLSKAVSSETANHQYNRTYGNIKLCQEVSKKYSPTFKRTINAMDEVLVGGGAVSLLNSAITSLVEPGDEAIAMEPFYDCYQAQIKFSSAKLLGLPLIPPSEKNEKWSFDFEKLKQLLNKNTKILILNTPNNPTGKILTYDELKQIAEILKDYPRVAVIMDEVYDEMVYDPWTVLPRMATIEGMWDRTMTIFSAGKFFSATGIRIGWCIAPKHLISIVNSVHQFSQFCIYEPLQIAVADSLADAEKPYMGYENYFKWLRAHYADHRDYMVDKLQKLGLKFFVPEGGYFVIVDISDSKNEPKHKFEGEEDEENNLPKDFNYTLNLAHEKGVVAIPCSAFYTPEHSKNGENYIRIAFCKNKEAIDDMFKRLSSGGMNTKF